MEEANRIDDESGRRPLPVRVKFASLRDRNLVLSASKTIKTKLKVPSTRNQCFGSGSGFFALKNSKSTDDNFIPYINLFLTNL